MRARTLDPILSNAGVASAYQKDLEKLIDDLFEAYSANIINELMSGEIMADAKPKTPEEIREKFEREAERIARKFVGSSDKHCRAGLINALKKAGYSPADIRKLRQRPADMDAILEQMVAENVALIRNIPEKVQKQIRAMVTKSAENNRDLGGLVEELKGLKEMTVRRARTISRDQNNKVTAQVSILRVQTLGITQGVWMHRSIGKTYRKSHVAMNGKTFDLSAGMWDEDAGEWVLPGQLVNCGCTYKPVLPELNQQPTEPTAETEAESTQPETRGQQERQEEHFEYGMTAEEREAFVEKMADIDSRIDAHTREMARAFGPFDGDLEDAAEKGSTRAALIKKVNAELKRAERYGDDVEISDAKERLAAIDKYFDARDEMWEAQKERVEMAPLGWPPITGTEKWKKLDGSRASNDIIDRANPNYERSRNAKTKAERSEYTENCQRCVPTWELIKRGYDVTALPTFNGDTLPLRRNATTIFKNAPLIDVAGKSEIENIAKSWGSGARGQVFVQWPGRRGGGHTFVFENINGKIVFIDPQTHNMDCSYYFKRVARGKTQILRLDTAEVSDVITKVCKEASA